MDDRAGGAVAFYSLPMAYQKSPPLRTWSGARRSAIQTLQTAHATAGELAGPGRPLEIGRPLAHAYVLRIVAEFQAFTRDLHDLAALRLAHLLTSDPQNESFLVTLMTKGRALDRGNATFGNLARDFERLGIRGLGTELGKTNAYWQKDKTFYGNLIRLRNCLAHGSQAELDELRREGIVDTVSWARDRLPGLDRIAKTLDRIVWEHLFTTFGVEPW